MATKASAASSPHCLLIPLPEHGHITPMLALACHLAAAGCTVTFLATEKPPLITSPCTHHQLHASHQTDQLQHSDPHSAGANAIPSNLRFRTLPYTGAPSLLTDRSPRFDILKQTLASLQDRHHQVEELVQEASASDSPISCVVCDILLCSWVVPLAKRQRIVSAILVPCSFTAFYTQFLNMQGKGDVAQRIRSLIGWPSQNQRSMKSEDEKRRYEEVIHVFCAAMTNVHLCSYVLANSCKVLENEVLDIAGESELRVRLIGPCFAADKETTPSGRAVNAMAKMAGSPFTENESCLSWLDKQGRNSVLLVSFGSEAIPDAEQVQELAKGIEASGCKFLWVVRPDSHMPPRDVLEGPRDVGMCAPWLPQRRVLKHYAVGGFLTHCGWNSTLESICYGVPMLCLPMNGDQYLNAHLVHTHWKVGLRLGPPNTLVRQADVEECVRELMHSDSLRQRAVSLQHRLQDAWLDCKNSISSFVQEIGKFPSLHATNDLHGAIG